MRCPTIIEKYTNLQPYPSTVKILFKSFRNKFDFILFILLIFDGVFLVRHFYKPLFGKHWFNYGMTSRYGQLGEQWLLFDKVSFCFNGLSIFHDRLSIHAIINATFSFIVAPLLKIIGLVSCIFINDKVVWVMSRRTFLAPVPKKDRHSHQQ